MSSSPVHELPVQYGARAATLTLDENVLEVRCKGQLWLQLPTELVLDVQWTAPSLSLAVLRPRLRAPTRPTTLTRAQWAQRHLDKSLEKLQLATYTFHATDAGAWAVQALRAAYPRTSSRRRVLVICNPSGGKGHGQRVLEQIVVPTLKAARCDLTVVKTTHRGHAYQVASELDADAFDALACVAGDGTVHEVVNGLASRADAERATRLPLVPVPTGSGNGLFVSLHGAPAGFQARLACLSVIKGTAHQHELMAITQPARAFDEGTAAKYVHRTTAANGEEYVQYYSFMSQAIGIMADIDIGTEWMRWLGDLRFTLGYLHGVLRNKPCPVDIDVLLGPHGTTSLQTMYERAGNAASARAVDDEPNRLSDVHALRHGSVVDDISPATKLNPDGATPSASSAWQRVDTVPSSVYAGKVPYVGRSLMAFPYVQPCDHLIDVLVQDQRTSAWRKIISTTHGETGDHIFDEGMHYLKVAAMRISPRVHASKHRYLSIDGEMMPYAAFQVETSALSLRLLSLDDDEWHPPSLRSPTLDTHGPRYAST